MNIKKILGLLLSLAIACVLLVFGTSSANALSCTTDGNANGDIYDGSWGKHFRADSGATCAYVTIYYNSWVDSNYHHHASYDLHIETGPIQGDDCVQLAFDWAAVGADHDDAQIMRNCLENSSRDMTIQSHDLDAQCSNGVYCAPGNWWVKRIQVSVFNTDNNSQRDRTCPTALAPLTDTSGECDGWNVDATWSSVAAKIRRTTNAGQEQQNTPLYPDDYGVGKIIDANH